MWIGRRLLPDPLDFGLCWQVSFEAAVCIFLAFIFSYHLEDLDVQYFLYEWSGLILRECLSIAFYLAFY